MDSIGHSDWMNIDMVEAHRRELVQIAGQERLARQVPQQPSIFARMAAWLRRQDHKEITVPVHEPAASRR